MKRLNRKSLKLFSIPKDEGDSGIKMSNWKSAAPAAVCLIVKIRILQEKWKKRGKKKKTTDDELDKVIKENHEMPTRFSAVGLRVWSHIKDRNRGRFHLQ